MAAAVIAIGTPRPMPIVCSCHSTWVKAKFSVSYADAFAAALAGLHDAVLLTGDPKFEALEKKGLLSIEWLNRL